LLRRILYRTFIAYGFVVRALRACGYAVTWVMNITDVDDKTIRRAKEKGVPLESITRRYEEQFADDMRALRFVPPDHLPRATDHIADMLQLIADIAPRKSSERVSENGSGDMTMPDGLGDDATSMRVSAAPVGR
jgi:cysteinyl-tRNA synthetase